MNRRRIALWSAAAITLLAGGAVLATNASTPEPQTRATPARAGVGALGRVEPASRVRKLSQPGGFAVNRVARLMVHEGERVQAGQLLAELSDAAQKDAAVTQAAAALAEARATLAKVVAAGRPSEIEAQEARIKALWAVQDMARRDAERSDKLLTSGAGAQATAERNRAAAARAAAEMAEAKAQLETLSRPRPEDVAVAEAQVGNAAGTLERAKADADLSRIRAPIDGVILKIYARTGDQIGSDGLLDMADLDHLDVVADVYETDLPRIRMGADAEVIVPGDPTRYHATVREIGWLVRRTTQAGADPVAAVDARTVEVRLGMSDKGREALARRTNMQVQVAIQP
ncbi:MAG: HlyD family efflux transporter periplasmic adaptor subunit [Acetobacteraceae bacterium]